MRAVRKIMLTMPIGAVLGAFSGLVMYGLGLNARPLTEQLPMIRDGAGAIDLALLALFGMLNSLAGPLASRRRHRLAWHLLGSAVFMLTVGMLVLTMGQTVLQFKTLVALGCALFAAMIVVIDYVQQHHPAVLVYACPMAAAFGLLSYAASLRVIELFAALSPLQSWLLWGGVFGGLLWAGLTLTRIMVVTEEHIEHRAVIEERDRAED